MIKQTTNNKNKLKEEKTNATIFVYPVRCKLAYV